jgi:hypothetical protein
MRTICFGAIIAYCLLALAGGLIAWWGGHHAKEMSDE